MQRILVTGAAGFIGHATAQRLLEQGCEVLGLDNLRFSYSFTSTILSSVIVTENVVVSEPSEKFAVSESEP